MTASSLPSKRLRILCVDDEPAIRELLARQLVLRGHRVETAADGRAGYQKVADANQAFDLVITDHQMPNLTGLEMVERLRANGYRGAVVFFSSTLAATTTGRLAPLNITAVIEKGASLSEIAAVLTRLETAG